MFDFVIMTILDYIKAVCPDQNQFMYNSTMTDADLDNQDRLTKLLQSIKLVFESLNNRVVVKNDNEIKDWVTADIIKL